MEIGDVDNEPISIYNSNFVCRVFGSSSNQEYTSSINNNVQFIALDNHSETSYNNGVMTDSYGGTNDITISGGDLFCNNQYSNFTLSSPTLSGSYNWSVSNSNLSITSGQTSSTATVKGKSSGGGDVTITGTISNGSCSYSKTKNTWVGPPKSSNIGLGVFQGQGSDYELCAMEYSQLIAATYNNASDPDPPIVGFDWDIYSDPSIVVNYWDNVASIPDYENEGVEVDLSDYYGGEDIDVAIRAYNACTSAYSDWHFQTFSVIDCGSYYYSMSPNPTSDELSIRFLKSDESASSVRSSVSGALTQANIPVLVEIYNSAQTRVLSGNGNVTDGEMKINTSTLKPGSYFVHVLVNGKVDKKHLLIE